MVQIYKYVLPCGEKVLWQEGILSVFLDALVIFSSGLCENSNKNILDCCSINEIKLRRYTYNNS